MKKSRTNMLVKKDNELVRNTMTQFDYKQNQIMAVLLGKYVHEKDNKCIDSTLTVSEFLNILEIDSIGGFNYVMIKNAIDGLAKNNTVGVMTGTKEKPVWEWRPFFSSIKFDTSTKIITFKWNDEMKPDLINLKNKYTAYLASDYLKLNTLYSQNLFEQMKSFQNIPKKPQVTFTLENLYRIFQVDITK